MSPLGRDGECPTRTPESMLTTEGGELHTCEDAAGIFPLLSANAGPSPSVSVPCGDKETLRQESGAGRGGSGIGAYVMVVGQVVTDACRPDHQSSSALFAVAQSQHIQDKREIEMNWIFWNKVYGLLTMIFQCVHLSHLHTCIVAIPVNTFVVSSFQLSPWLSPTLSM